MTETPLTDAWMRVTLGPEGAEVLRDKTIAGSSAAYVSRREYDELFMCCSRLTDRIEALELAVGRPLENPAFTTGPFLLTDIKVRE